MNAKTKKYFLIEGSEVFAGPYWDKAEAQAAARREGKYSPSPGIWKKKRLRVKAVTSNPAAEAAEASTEFHGRGPDELVPVNGIMDVSQAKTRFFKRDSVKAD